MNEKRTKAAKALQDAELELSTLELLYKVYCAQFDDLEGIEKAAYLRMLDVAKTKRENAEQKVKMYGSAEHCEWLHFRDIQFTGKDGKTWNVDARYTKDADANGDYHWIASGGPITDLGGIQLRESKEHLHGSFKKRNSAKTAAWKNQEKLVKKYKKIERKHVPAKRTNRGTIKREYDADGKPLLTDAEQRAKERALHGLNQALSKRSRK